MQITGNIKSIDPVSPDPGLIAEAVEVIKGGGIVSFPTTCLYGLGGDALKTGVVDRIFGLKKRSSDKPILVLVKDPGDLPGITQDISIAAAAIMERFWPGNVTIVFKAAESLPGNLTAGTCKIGVRVPVHPVTCALVKELGTPLTGTSANLSGRPGCAIVSEIDSAILDQVDLVLDAGRLKGGAGSTVVDVTGPVPGIMREGEVSAHDIMAAVEKPARL